MYIHIDEKNIDRAFSPTAWVIEKPLKIAWHKADFLLIFLCWANYTAATYQQNISDYRETVVDDPSDKEYLKGLKSTPEWGVLSSKEHGTSPRKTGSYSYGMKLHVVMLSSVCTHLVVVFCLETQ